MKARNVIFTAVVAVAMIMASGASAQLVNGGFETGDITGWDSPNGWSSASTDYALSGTYSGLTDSTAAGAWAVPQLGQAGFATAPGDVASFSGYALQNGVTDGSFGLLKIVFRDSLGNDLDGGTATIGTWVGPANPGAESGQVNSGTAAETWNFLEVAAIAPAGTASTVFLALNVNQGLAPAKFYFDDLAATVVPEPATIGLVGIAGLGMFVARRRFKI